MDIYFDGMIQNFTSGSIHDSGCLCTYGSHIQVETQTRALMALIIDILGALEDICNPNAL